MSYRNFYSHWEQNQAYFAEVGKINQALGNSLFVSFSNVLSTEAGGGKMPWRCSFARVITAHYQFHPRAFKTFAFLLWIRL